MMYRKKPVVIEAHRLDMYNATALATWCDGVVELGEFDLTIKIYTLEGIMTANYGDYIIKGVKGEFYPCKPDIFAATYEEVK